MPSGWHDPRPQKQVPKNGPRKPPFQHLGRK